MKKSKKLFLIFAILFFGAMGYLAYDISSRTTFPGSKPQLKERLLNSDERTEEKSVAKDSTKQDTISDEN
ncbi:hypothetical protein E1176_18635 [Fulvivirga sp. RKSG066]|uniref:hypothetical protein n=1 Tax=Fulvivirga aurantia TaxID=2529383 RepID=UPI0012BC33E4|nr:hypothetical protein [Fulvivirga aurantia]MTI23054.1 hypothetical protein [Fulvivirga aurantia]